MGIVIFKQFDYPKKVDHIRYVQFSSIYYSPASQLRKIIERANDSMKEGYVINLYILGNGRFHIQGFKENK